MDPVALDTFWRMAAAAPIALAAVLLATPLVIRLAHRLDWLAYPQQDRWHSDPTALMGGIAIVAGASVGTAAIVPFTNLWAIGSGAAVMFGVGLVDDLWEVKPAAKLAAQVVATGLLLYAGYAFGHDWPLWLSLPLTLLWVIGITNAVNLLDNMDGLAAGIAGIAATVLAAFGALTGSPTALGIAAGIAGAAFGFLAFNFNPAKIFMGDCGSLVLGYVIAALALVIQQEAAIRTEIGIALVPLAALAVPIFDTTLVTVVRKLAGRSVSQGGRDHTSHRLVFLGLSERAAVLMLYGISLGSGAVALAVLFADVKLFYALAAFMAVALTVLGIHLARANVYREQAGGDGAPVEPSGYRPLRLLHDLFGHRWKAFVGIIGDTLVVAGAFVLAHYLRFESGLSGPHDTRMVEALPLVVAAKIAVFYAGGLYRGIWRHAGTPELIRTVLSTAAAGLAAFGVLGLLHGWTLVSEAVLFIDWMTVTLGIIGTRFGFRGLRQYLASRRRDGRRVLLYGAGDAGLLVLRELRQNPDLNLTPIGFLDDDPLKQGQRVQGLPVLGSGEELGRVCRAEDIQEVIVTTAKLPEHRRRFIYQSCQSLDLQCRTFEFAFRPLTPPVRVPGERPEAQSS